MANLFDPANSPTLEPEEIVVGDYLLWRRTDISGNYPPALYTATYVAKIAGGNSTEVQVTGTNYNGQYLFTVTSAQSANFTVGDYHWQLEVVRNSDGNRIVVDRGEFKAVPDLDNANADPRSHAQIMLAKIESILQGRADGDVASYSINGRSLTKLPLSDLMMWRDRYKAEYIRELRKDRIRRGIGTGANILVRF